jgi:hypothetical protein
MKRILAFLVAATAALALAAQPVSEIDVLLGQTMKYYPAGTHLIGFSVVEGEENVEVTQIGHLLELKGLKAGDAKLRLALRAGKESELLVHVKSVSFIRRTTKPEEPQAPEWTGFYELRLPENHYSIIFHSFESDGRERVQESYSCIDNVFVVGESCESEDGFGGMSDIIDVFDFSDQLGYNGGLMPNGHYKLFYGDGNEINPDNVRDGEEWFKMYAPETLAVALIGIDPADFGRDNHGDEDLENGTIMQRIRMTGGNQSMLKRYYKGEEIVCGRTCWVFDFRGTNLLGYGGYCVWIDTETGLALRHEAEDGGGFIVTRFDLNYTDWDIEIRPDLFE